MYAMSAALRIPSLSNAASVFSKQIVHDWRMPLEFEVPRYERARSEHDVAARERERERVDRRFAPMRAIAGRWS